MNDPINVALLGSLAVCVGAIVVLIVAEWRDK